MFKVGDRVESIGWAKPSKGTISNAYKAGDEDRYHVRLDAKTRPSHAAWEEDGRFFICQTKGEIRLINPSQKILITHDGTKTLARLYEGNVVIKSAEANCSPHDPFYFPTGASLAFQRLMGEETAKTEPAKEDKHQYKAGDTVRVIGNESRHDYSIGDIAILEKYTGRYWCTQKGCGYDVYECDIEPYAKPEPVKMYCVKEEPHEASNQWFTKGKVYERNGSRIDTDCGERIWCEWMPRFLVPLVSRPAKVGEWVYVTENAKGDESYASHGIYANRIYKVVGFGFAPIIETTDKSDKGWTINAEDYLVLDGFKPDKYADYEWIDGVKGFKGDLTCRGYQYAIGRTESLPDGEEEVNGNHAIGQRPNGFHFCATKEDVIRDTDYKAPDSRYCKVRGFVKKGSTGPVYCARKLEVVEEITEPKYYSGKVVCVEEHDFAFTVGKIYTFTDGKVIDNDGDARPSGVCHFRAKTLDEWNDSMWRDCIAKFIELTD